MIQAFLFMAGLFVQQAYGEDFLLAKTTLGLVQGHFNEAGIREWKGLGYAKPPVGNLRWEYPQTPDPHKDIYVANFNAPGCAQTCKLPPGNCPEYGIGEDCLYLTVYAPAKPSVDPNGYPVLFWIHGGAFEQGLGNCALYNGTNFAQQNVVSVVINYRLGALGFTTSKSMQGNYGFLDQRLALQWANDNIRAFGGNPNHITIAGQSAGAMSVGCHLVSPNSKGLFQYSIMESNPLGLPFHTRESAEANANDLFTYLGCAADDIACMRTKSIEEILDAQDHAIKLDLSTLLLNFLPFAPMIESQGEIPEQPLVALAAGHMPTTTPMLSGSLYDEGQLFVYELFPKPLNELEYKGIIDGVFGIKKSRTILHKYPFTLLPNNTDGRNILNILATDLLFYCPLRNITQGYLHAFDGQTNGQRGVQSNQRSVQSSVQSSAIMPTYIYRFKHVVSFDCWGENYTFCVGSCCHGSELPFVFNVFTDGVTVSYEPNTDEQALTVDLSHAWTNFITSGDPNKGRYHLSKVYPQYTSEKDVLVVLDEPDSDVQSHVRTTYCDLWDQLGYFY